MEIVVLIHNIRSILNVGSIFRSCEGFGVNKIYLSGYTPSPDNGLPHVRTKIKNRLRKTALGAEELMPNIYIENITKTISELKKSGFRIVGLEQDKRSVLLPDFKLNRKQKLKIALLLGEEVHGIEPHLRALCDDLIEIPMFGKKESFNVAVATGIALYEITKGQNVD